MWPWPAARPRPPLLPLRKPPEPTKAAAPAAQPSAAAAQPTAVPAKKVEYPVKGKAISIVVGWATGGGNDILARLVAPLLEKELGTPVNVVNKPGAGGQMGFADAALAAPDGYTIGMTVMPSIANVYLDPERKANFNMKSFLPVGLIADEPVVISVRADSPYKTAKDVIEAAKANPQGIKMADSGIGAASQSGVLGVEKAAGVKFGQVHFNGDSEIFTALLGGHVDVGSTSTAGALGHFKSGAIRVIGLTSKDNSSFYPGVQSFANQGYDVNVTVARGLSVPAATSPEVARVLSDALKKVTASEDFIKRAGDAAIPIKYLDMDQYAKRWADDEKEVGILMELAKKSQ